MTGFNVVSIAASDSSGGAGIQADIKTIHSLQSHCLNVVTAITAQNSLGVAAVYPVPVQHIHQQWQTLQEDITIDAIKVGVIADLDAATWLAQLLLSNQLPVVIDPVFAASSGQVFVDDAMLSIYREQLLPAACLVTPNVSEAQQLLATDRCDPKWLVQALHGMGSKQVLLTGGEQATAYECCDYFYDGEQFVCFSCPSVLSNNTHGTGCTLSSALIVSYLNTSNWLAAIAAGKSYVQQALYHARHDRLGRGKAGLAHQSYSVHDCVVTQCEVNDD